MESENIQNLVTKMTITSETESTKPKIYESPNDGKTIYWRYFGEDEKHLLRHDENFKYPWEK